MSSAQSRSLALVPGPALLFRVNANDRLLAMVGPAIVEIKQDRDDSTERSMTSVQELSSSALGHYRERSVVDHRPAVSPAATAKFVQDPASQLPDCAKPIFINGKFYSGGMTGVHRVADRLIRELDSLCADMPSNQKPDITLLAPAASDWLPDLSSIRTRTFPKTGQIWEQFFLPFHARSGVLVNFANLSPILHGRKITFIHDAQFLLRDCGYPLRQRIGYRFLVPRMARSSRHVVTVSEFSRRMLEMLGVTEREKISVIHNGGDHIMDGVASDAMRIRHGLDEYRYVVMFGCPRPYKNNRIVFEAFDSGKLDGLQLVMVGADREEFVAAGYEVPKDAIFVGKPSDAELRGLLVRALALTCPSLTEGFGLPPLEAMYCNCPAIVAPSGAIPEVCEDAVLYADVDDPGSWVEQILKLRDDQALRSWKIARGQERAQSFTWKAATRSLYSLIASA